MENELKRKFDIEVVPFEGDWRGRDLSDLDLSGLSLEQLSLIDFNTETIWPEASKLPPDFTPEMILENGKNPGLGVRELQREGIDGRGVNVAIIDQKLFLDHEEYRDQLVDYQETALVSYGPEMHGAAVASLLAGKECGVAPAVELHYQMVPSGRDFNYWAQAIDNIIAMNRQLPAEEKIRIISCSIGFEEGSDEKGIERAIESLKMALESGIIVIHTTMQDLPFSGCGSLMHKDDLEKYQPWLEEIDVEPDTICIPSDYRTFASLVTSNSYEYNAKGGLSWSVPYLSGLFALALQINPQLNRLQLIENLKAVSFINNNGIRIIRPKEFIKSI